MPPTQKQRHASVGVTRDPHTLPLRIGMGFLLHLFTLPRPPRTVYIADAGNNLIVDDVNTGEEWREYDTLLAHHSVHRIGILCPLDILEAREAARGDRLIGLARWQFPRVHAGRDYDFTVDTGASSAEACARLIRARFDL